MLSISWLLGLAQSITNLTIEASLCSIFFPCLVFDWELLDRREQDVFFILLQFLLFLIEDCLDAFTLQADSVFYLSKNALLVLIDLLALWGVDLLWLWAHTDLDAISFWPLLTVTCLIWFWLHFGKIVLSLLFLLINLFFWRCDRCLCEDVCEFLWLFFHYI